MSPTAPTAGFRRTLAEGLGSLRTLHWLVLAVSLAVTTGAWWIARDLVAERGALRFERESTRLIDMVTGRLQQHDDALQAGLSMIAARGGDIDRKVWREFADSLDIARRYPGINGLGVIRRVDGDDLDALVARERRSDPGFEVHPPWKAEEHFPIVYVEPEANNREAIGLDLGVEANRREGIRRALRSGTTQLTAPIVLVQDEARSPGFLMLAPWLGTSGALPLHASPEVSFEGLVYAPFIVDKLMSGALDSARRGVTVAIDDSGETLYDEHTSATSGHDPDPLFVRSEVVQLYGRPWRFDLRSNLAFRDALGLGQPTLVLIGGLTIDALLLALLVGLTRTHRALVRVEQMHADLAHQAQALAESNADLERFASVASHDLKTPLRGIGDLVWYLEEDLAPYLDSDERHPDVPHHLERLNAQVRRMEALIAGILDYSAASERTLHTERFATREVFDDIIETLGIAERQLVLEGVMPTLDSCRTRFVQVMSNIVGNAFKYHPEPEHALVTVSCRRQGAHHRFSISDDGNGIDPRFHERIFEMFQTLQPYDDVESTGMGLSIVRKILDRVGGSVSVSSRPGRGTTFHVLWPQVTARAHDTLREAA